MEDHIDKIVYIVIAVIITIVSAVVRSSGKKKPVAAIPKPQANIPGGEEWTPLKQQVEKKTESFIDIPTLENTEKSVTERPRVAGTVSDDPDDLTSISLDDMIKQDKIDQETPDAQHPFMKDFDPEKAIIYSEIMRKKSDTV